MEELFNSYLQELEATFSDGNSLKVITYLHNYWLPYKIYFAHAWTNKSLHFGELASSRSEGGHHTIKSWIKQSTSDLLVAVDRIELAIQQQNRDLRQIIASERQSIAHIYNIPLYSQLVCRVSKFALNLIHERYGYAI